MTTCRHLLQPTVRPGRTGASVHRLRPPLGNESRRSSPTRRPDLRPRHREPAATHTPVCARPPACRPLRPAEDPLPGLTPIHLARTPRVRQTLLQVMHYLFPGKATAAQTLWTVKAAPGSVSALELDFHGLHREASPVFRLYIHPSHC